MQSFSKILLHSVCFHFGECTRLREGVQSSKLKILSFRTLPSKRVWSPSQGHPGGGGEIRDARFLCGPRNGSDTAGWSGVGPGVRNSTLLRSRAPLRLRGPATWRSPVSDHFRAARKKKLALQVPIGIRNLEFRNCPKADSVLGRTTAIFSDNFRQARSPSNFSEKTD